MKKDKRNFVLIEMDPMGKYSLLVASNIIHGEVYKNILSLEVAGNWTDHLRVHSLVSPIIENLFQCKGQDFMKITIYNRAKFFLKGKILPESVWADALMAG